jgi:hypothetical protein
MIINSALSYLNLTFTPTKLTFLNRDYSCQSFELIVSDIAQELNLTEKLTFLRIKEKKEKNLICLKLDLSNQYPGSTDTELKANDETLYRKIKYIFNFVNQKFEDLEHPYSCAISVLNLSQNHISEESFLPTHEDTQEEKEHRYLMLSILNEIEKLNLNDTKISSTILNYLCACKKLKILKLDKCKKNLDLAKPLLNQIFPRLQKLSLVNMSSDFTQDDLLIERIEEIFPQINQIDLTQAFDKFLGITDSIQVDSIVHPMISKKCGHVFSQAIAEDKSLKKCALCCTPLKGWLEGHFPITCYIKIDGKWKSTILDFNRQSLKGRVYFHPSCHHLFTEDTLKKLFGSEHVSTETESQSKEFIKNLHHQHITCPGCYPQSKKLEVIRIYPNLTQDDELEACFQQKSLKEMAKYIKP